MSQVLGSGCYWIQEVSSPNNQVLLLRRVDTASRFYGMVILESPFYWQPLADQLLESSENTFICIAIYSSTRMKGSTVLLSDDRNCLTGVMKRWWWRRKYFLSVSQLKVNYVLDVQSSQLRQCGYSFFFLWKWLYFLIYGLKNVTPVLLYQFTSLSGSCNV